MSPLRSLLSRAKKSPLLLARVGGGEDRSEVKKKDNVTEKHILNNFFLFLFLIFLSIILPYCHHFVVGVFAEHSEELKRNTLQLEKLSDDVKRNTLQLETIAKEVEKNQDLINQLIDLSEVKKKGNVTEKHILKHSEELKRNTLQLEKDVKRNTLQLETIAKEVKKNQDLINQLIDPDPTIEQGDPDPTIEHGAQRFFYLASVGFLIGYFVLKSSKWKKKTDEEAPRLMRR